MPTIPLQAHKVFEGVVFDVYQWQQPMYDGSIRTFEMIKRPNGVRTIATKGGKILITKQLQPDSKYPYYVFPGGRMDPGEMPLQAAKRELQEETGLVSEDFLHYASYDRMYKVAYESRLFIARDCVFAGEQQLDGGEKVELVWMDFEEILAIIFSEGYGFPPFANHLFRLEKEGKLDEFREILGV